jgi:DNA-binding MarR family transcriptional regulator
MSDSALFIYSRKMNAFSDTRINLLLKDQDLKACYVPYILEIGNNEGCSMKELSILTGSDKGLTTRMVRALIQSDYVTNITESNRTYRLYLTQKGVEAFDISKSAIEQVLNNLFESLDETDKHNLKVVTEKLSRRMDASYRY